MGMIKGLTGSQVAKESLVLSAQRHRIPIQSPISDLRFSESAWKASGLDHELLSVNYGRLWGIEAYCFGLLGFWRFLHYFEVHETLE